MLKRSLRAAIIVLLAAWPWLGLAAPASAEGATGTLFGVTGCCQGELSMIDPAAGIVTDIEDLAGPDQFQVLSVTGDPIAHRLYAIRDATIFIPPSTIENRTQVLTLDSDNGAILASASTASPGHIAFDPGTNTVYQVGMSGVVRLDPTTGKTVPVASFAAAPGGIATMVVVPGAHTIYLDQTVWDPETGQYAYDIITVNTLTGATATSPVNAGFLPNIVYDPAAGLLLAVDNMNLFSVDPASGATSLIGTFNTNPQALFLPPAIDPTTNTVFVHLSIYDFYNPVDAIASINDLSGTSSVSSGNLTNIQVYSMYFQPEVTVTPASLTGDVQSSLTSGQITKAGVANALLSDLNAAGAARSRGQCKTAANIYQQFISDVAAQAGKSIAIATASRLTSEAEALQSNCP